ncbi:protein SCO2 homolog, mitochondrial-like [Hemiscyllium ocellatum]|uniref:protein SCO2 homolog, mitochondrial-like n=1 Tax=Hemiscyllium ocellatum TaxID=170820 RepID=UPI002965D6E5|nr:protein SCO2 homolog, mitochondrial-like [Hemiscyllium ocellatum]
MRCEGMQKMEGSGELRWERVSVSWSPSISYPGRAGQDRGYQEVNQPGMFAAMIVRGHNSCWQRLRVSVSFLRSGSPDVGRSGGLALRHARCLSNGHSGMKTLRIAGRRGWHLQSTSIITDCNQKINHRGSNQLYCFYTNEMGLIIETLAIPSSQISGTDPNYPLASLQVNPQLTICKASSQPMREKPHFPTQGRLLMVHNLPGLSSLPLVHISLGCPTFLPHRLFSQSASDRSSRSPQISLWSKFMVTCFFGSALMGLWYYVHLEKKQQEKVKRQEQLKKLALGQGDFNLLDHTGKSRTKKDFFGKWVLLYFGFTHCPDICPDELDKMSSVVQILDKDRALTPVQPIFITVDPERDGVKEMAKYIKDFHSRMIGLTGTPEQIKDLGKAFRVYYSAGPKDEDNDYIVDHTIIIYLLNPDGLLTDYYNRSKNDQEIAESIRSHMKSYVDLFS